MLNQILITALVLVVVVVFTRMRRRSEREDGAGSSNARRGGSGSWRMPSTPAIIGYSLVLVMVVGATIVFYLQWMEANSVVTIEVVDARSGATTTYHVFKKDIGERTFHTVDGRYVSLGAADRMELSEN